MKIKFDCHKNEKQHLAWKYFTDNETDEIVYGGSKGSGKTHLGVSAIFALALIYPDTKYFIARRSRTDLTNHTIPSIKKVLNEWGVDDSMYRYNGQTFTFTLANQSTIILIECDYRPSNPDFERFGSAQFTCGFIEEGGEIVDKAKRMLSATIGRWNNEKYRIKAKLLITCNPAKNFLYSEFYLPSKNGTLPKNKKFIQALPADNKMIDAGYLDRLNEVLTHNEKLRLLEGLWEFDDDKRALVQYQCITSAFSNEYVPRGTKYLTCDIARLGKDSTLIIEWDGLRAIPFQYHKLTIPEIVQQIEIHRLRNDIPKHNVICDEGGLGVGVVDTGGYQGYISGAKAFEENTGRIYRNLRAQCFLHLSKKINDNEIYIDCHADFRERITKELEQVKCTEKSLSGSEFQIISKDEQKAILGFSPDFVDAMSMRMFFDLQPKFEVDYSNFQIL